MNSNEPSFNEFVEYNNDGPLLQHLNPINCPRNDDGEKPEVQSSCSYFRQMVKRITSITDDHILDEIERLHVECKNCKVTNDEQNYGSTKDVQQTTINSFQTPCEEPSSEFPFKETERMQAEVILENARSTQDVNVNQNAENLIAKYGLNDWIDLRNQHLTSAHMNMVVERAIIDKRCKVLDLGSNFITVDGASNLAEGLLRSQSLQRLYLSGNQVSNDGVSHLASSVQNSSLFVLGLSENMINDQGIYYLSQMLAESHRLKVLGLEKNQISDKGVEMLAEVLKNKNSCLEHLLLAGNAAITDSSVKSLVNMLQYNTSLTRLDLRSCSLSDIAKTQLRKMAAWRRKIQV